MNDIIGTVGNLVAGLFGSQSQDNTTDLSIQGTKYDGIAYQKEVEQNKKLTTYLLIAFAIGITVLSVSLFKRNNMANIADIGNIISSGISSLGSVVKSVFQVTETGKTNRTQLETDAEKYGSDSVYASSVATQQGKTIRVLLISISAIFLAFLVFKLIKPNQ
jgi:hypothetical protein